MSNPLFQLNQAAYTPPVEIPRVERATMFDGLTTVSPSLRPTSRGGSETPLPQLPPALNSPEDCQKRAQLPPLPQVECIARARIPTTNDTEIYLHLYANDIDQKEHLAIVFGENIRSKTLFRQRGANEPSQDRMTRGAYVGKLYPGRTDANEDTKMGLKLVFDETTGELLGEVNLRSSISEAEQIQRLREGKPACDPTLARIHSECYTGETAWSARCDCGEQFDEAGRLMGREGRGVIVYLRQEGRGIGLGEKLKAYNLQDLGADTVQANLLLRHPADGRSFGLATSILLDLGLEEIKLMTNNPDKIIAVEGNERQVRVIERVPMVPLAWRGLGGGIKSKEVDGYLRTKIEKMGHMLDQK